MEVAMTNNTSSTVYKRSSFILALFSDITARSSKCPSLLQFSELQKTEKTKAPIAPGILSQVILLSLITTNADCLLPDTMNIPPCRHGEKSPWDAYSGGITIILMGDPIAFSKLAWRLALAYCVLVLISPITSSSSSSRARSLAPSHPQLYQ